EGFSEIMRQNPQIRYDLSYGQSEASQRPWQFVPSALYRSNVAGSTIRSDLRAATPEIRAIVIVTVMAEVKTHQRNSIFAPAESAAHFSANTVGSAMSAPSTPIQNDCPNTDNAIRQRGMPRA